MFLSSQNFFFLEHTAPQLSKLGAQAERYFEEDPNTSLVKLRQFGEVLAKVTAANLGIHCDPNDTRSIVLLERIQTHPGVTKVIMELFHQLRIAGNQAVHALKDDRGIVLTNLKNAHRLAIWFHKSFGRERDFKPLPFQPPVCRSIENEKLQAEIKRLQAAMELSLSTQEIAEARATKEAALRQTAEERHAALKELQAEVDQALTSLQERIGELESEAENRSQKDNAQLTKRMEASSSGLDLDEADTRRLIDAQLRQAGWEVDSDNLSYSTGVRPQKGHSMAIAEWPTKSGPADYALFIGMELVGFIEAKRESINVSGVLTQAKRYSRDFRAKGEERLTTGAPWQAEEQESYSAPFVFSTNGRPYHKDLETLSGIWFCDLRKPENIARPLRGWKSPKGLQDLLSQDHAAAHEQLKTEGFNYGRELRDYQKDAIKAAEEAISKGQREILLAMATGTGKTATCIALAYRLLKINRFQRILFLVDRSALGSQTEDAFHEAMMEQLQKFTHIYDLKGMKEAQPDDATRVHIATVQSLVKRLLYTEDQSAIPAIDQYDCIVVDECHRGYLLDREMSETEILFRDQTDYLSKYRYVLDYFDAVKIGLTATPALHTSEIFGKPIYTYSYREAVVDGYLIDHEPPVRIHTALSQGGIAWAAGEELEAFNTKTGEIDLVSLPDALEFDVSKFNKEVLTSEFNRVVCETLLGQTGDIKEPIDIYDAKKTLVFCANDAHADTVVNEMKKAMEKLYGKADDNLVMKITGKADKPNFLIRQFKNEAKPKIVVTVDLLTTGIDVPEICNLVFLRRVNSRILYDQMLGRATRLCPDLNKEFFRVFDAVGIYDGLQDITAMKPVAVNPSFTFTQLVEEFLVNDQDQVRRDLQEQIIAKLQRTKSRYSKETTELIETSTGYDPKGLARWLKSQEPENFAQWLKERPKLSSLLDHTGKGTPRRVAISTHEDKLVATEVGYGTANKPEDYLADFEAFLKDNINTIPALAIVTQRPRELTRQQLKELRLKLEEHGFREADLRTAWRDVTNHDVAASIIGFVRQAALGDPIRPYAERVEEALKKLLAKDDWSPIQRKWLERITKQLENEANEPVIDPESFAKAPFVNQGGFKQANKIFEGRLEQILQDINAEVWKAVS
ncbi:type I restriction-modification system endonuclease [Kiloniella sp. b19]|uniref:type I restriction-modification system endonuclease n=1 Tax=Kiloniella sp. GXU_MW_B19 TaxID=3141326 RepID=UPI0031CFC71C